MGSKDGTGRFASVRSSTRVKDVVRSEDALRKLVESMRRLGADEALIAKVASQRSAERTRV